jgi:hypothetical protein
MCQLNTGAYLSSTASQYRCRNISRRCRASEPFFPWSCKELVIGTAPQMFSPASSHGPGSVYDLHLLHLGGTTSGVASAGMIASVELRDSVSHDWLALPELP